MSHTLIIPDIQKREMIKKARNQYGDNITLLPKMANGNYHDKRLENGFTVLDGNLTLWFNDGIFTHALSEKIVLVTDIEWKYVNADKFQDSVKWL